MRSLSNLHWEFGWFKILFRANADLKITIQFKIGQGMTIPWCNGSHHGKWNSYPDFESWRKLVSFHLAVIITISTNTTARAGYDTRSKNGTYKIYIIFPENPSTILKTDVGVMIKCLIFPDIWVFLFFFFFVGSFRHPSLILTSLISSLSALMMVH